MTAAVLHHNSLAAFHGLDRAKRCAAIMRVYSDAFEPLSDRAVMERLGFTDMNMVRPRITDLLKAGKLIELFSKRDPTTGKTVRHCINAALFPEQP